MLHYVTTVTSCGHVTIRLSIDDFPYYVINIEIKVLRLSRLVFEIFSVTP